MKKTTILLIVNAFFYVLGWPRRVCGPFCEGLGASWGAMGGLKGILRRSWEVLGGLGEVRVGQGALGKRLGRPWEPRGGSRGLIERSWGPRVVIQELSWALMDAS